MENNRLPALLIITILGILLISSLVFAQAEKKDSNSQLTEPSGDIEILINDAPLSTSYSVMPDQELKITLRTGTGVLIKEVSLTSDNAIVGEFLNQALQGREHHREGIPVEDSTTVRLPPTLPSGDSKIYLTITYDKDFNIQTLKATTLLSVTGGSRTLGILSGLITDQAAVETVNWLSKRQIPRENPSLTLDDLSAENLAELGVNKQTFLEGLALRRESETLSAMGKTSEANSALAKSKARLPEIKETASKETNPSIGELKVKLPRVKSDLDGELSPSLALTSKTYRVSAGEKQITKSKYRLSVSALEDEGVSDVNIIALIPKEAAQNIGAVTFGQKPSIIDPDPVVKWAFKNIPQGQVKDYTFTVDKDVQNFEVLAGASAEKPSMMFRIIKWIIGMFETPQE